MSTLYLHIGFPKTATTFIQKVVLPEITSIKCFAKPKVRLGDRKDRLGTRFYYSPQLWADRGKEVLGQVLGPEPQGKVKEDVLISDEGFGGGLTGPRPWMPSTRPHHDRENGPFLTQAHLAEFRKVLMNWGFSQLKVIMGIRRQDRKMASGYAQVSDKVRGASQENFERWVHRVLDPDRGYYEGGGVQHNYYLFQQKISKAVGEENVVLLPLEHLKEDRSEYLRRLFDFLEIPKEGDRITESLARSSNLKRNVHSSSEDTWQLRPPRRNGPRFRPWRVFRALGFPFRMPLRWPDFRRGQRVRLTPELQSYILDTFAEGNRRLDQKVDDLDLQSYGYWTESETSKAKRRREEKSAVRDGERKELVHQNPEMTP